MTATQKHRQQKERRPPLPERVKRLVHVRPDQDKRPETTRARLDALDAALARKQELVGAVEFNQVNTLALVHFAMQCGDPILLAGARHLIQLISDKITRDHPELVAAEDARADE